VENLEKLDAINHGHVQVTRRGQIFGLEDFQRLVGGGGGFNLPVVFAPGREQARVVSRKSYRPSTNKM